MKVGDVVTLTAPYASNAIYGGLLQVTRIEPWPQHPDRDWRCFYADGFSPPGPWNASEGIFRVVGHGGPW